MYYIEGYDLPAKEYASVYDMYPDLGEQDVMMARYRVEPGFEHRPDICALPPPLKGAPLVMANSSCRGATDYERRNMTKGDRLTQVWRLKQTCKAYLPYHTELERVFRECLIGAYSQRRFAISDGDDKKETQLRSMAPGIARSVPDMSLIGTAGTGKSTAASMMLARYPQGIYHVLPDGKCIMQIPYLEITAYADSNQKALYLALAARIDKLLGNTSYAEKISKMALAPMEVAVGELIEQFHVGIIVIDEIQLSKDKKMFENLLRLTANHGVSIMLIGTEEAVEMLNKNEWFARRFSHLGRIAADMKLEDQHALRAVLKQIWQCQWTKKPYQLTDDCVDFFTKESGGNIDLITSIYVVAQMLVIESEGSKKELDLNVKTLKKAANWFPNAKKLILDGKQTIEDAYIEERNKVMTTVGSAAQEAKKLEAQQLNAMAADLSSEKTALLNDITWRVMACTDTTEKTIEKAFLRLLANGVEFAEMSPVNRAEIIRMSIRGELKEEKQETASAHTNRRRGRTKREPSVSVQKSFNEAMENADATSILSSDGISSAV